MSRPRLALALLVLSAVGLRAADLPVNRWVKAAGKGGGIREGAAIIWWPEQSKFLVAGGARGNEKLGIPLPYEVQTFDPATRTWANCFPKGKEQAWAGKGGASKAPGFAAPADYVVSRDKEGNTRLSPRTRIAGYSACDAEAKRLYVCLPAHTLVRELAGTFPILRYDAAARRWQVFSKAAPPVAVRDCLVGEFSPRRIFLEGTKAVFDPVNRELLLLGGRHGAAPGGNIGHWAFAVDTKRWRPLLSPSPLLDPLRVRCLKARRLARDGLAAARSLFYAGLGSEQQHEKVGPQPRKLLAAAHRETEELRQAAQEASTKKPPASQAQALARAISLLEEAERHLQGATGMATRRDLTAELLRDAFDAAWALDEAADCLASSPPPRKNAAAAYDPMRKRVVLFGGSHGDYLRSDTWVYECRHKRWRQVWPATVPPPRHGAGMLWLPRRRQLALIGGYTYQPKFFVHQRRDRFLADGIWLLGPSLDAWSLVRYADHGDAKAAPPLSCDLAAGPGDLILGLAVHGRWNRKTGETWLLRVAPTGGATGRGVKPATRAYLSVVPQYDPRWYDAAERGDPEAARKWIAGLKPNTWTPVPQAPRPCPQRDWGTAAFDPDRDQIYRWTGGHMADPASIVHTYHPAINRWSIGYVAEYAGKGLTFNGRPDCQNHTYLNYAYDIASKRLVAASFAGTSVYNPNRRDWEFTVPQPFRQHPYYTKTVSTPRGVVVWTGRHRCEYFGRFDAAARAWRKLPVKGTMPPAVHGDENTITYDSKRNVLWLTAATGYQKPNGQVWRYDMATGDVKKMSPAGADTIGMLFRQRESAYLPEPGLVLFNYFHNDDPATMRSRKQPRLLTDLQVVYDPGRNRWARINIRRGHRDLGTVSIGLVCDSRRNMLWALSASRRMFALKLDPDAIQVVAEKR